MAAKWEPPKWPRNVQRRPGPRPPHPHQSVAIVARWTAAGAFLAVLVLWGDPTGPRLLVAIALALFGGLWGYLRAERVSDSDRWQKRHRR